MCLVNDKFLGTTVSKKITVNILNPNNEINLENKEIEVYVGSNDEYVPMGNFIIDLPPENEEVKEKTSFTGYDYMIKFEIPYEDDNVYPISLKQFLENLCTKAGLTLGSETLVNENYTILANPFTENETCRTVLSTVAELCGGFAKVGRDNKVYIVTLNKETILETIDGNVYDTSFIKNNEWGKINSLVIKANENVEGEHTIRQDEESIIQNGKTEIVILNNPFLINEEQRNLVIEGLWQQLKGIKYLPFKTSYYGFPYIDSGDFIKILDCDDNEYYTYIFNHTFTYNGSFDGNIETTALTTTQSTYQNNNDIKSKFKRVEFVVNKVNGEIQSVIEEQNEQNEKVSKLTQTVDNFSSEISNKVGEDEIISKINQSAEAIQIGANKISLEGKEIDLTGDNVTITSNNFSVDEEGNIVCKNALITGGEINVTKTYFSEDAEKYVTETIFKISEDIIEIGKFNFFPTIDSMSGDLLPNFGIENIAILKYNKGYSGLVPFDLNINNIKAAAEITTEILYAKNSIMISKNGTQGYGLCNSDGASIIRDYNNKNVTVDATGGELFLGFQNTTGLNFLNSKAAIDSGGNFVLNGETYYRGKSGSNTINLLRAYSNTTALGDGGYVTGIYGSQINLKAGTTAESWLVVNGTLRPGSNGSHTLGQSGYYWSNGYITKLYFNELVEKDMNVAVVSGDSTNSYFGTGGGSSGKTTNLRGNTVRLYAHSGGGVYLGNSGSTAVTSDENLKHIYDIDDKYIDFFNNLKPVTYKYKSNGHRKHFGFGARQVEKSLIDAGLTTEDFAGVLIDKDVTIGADENGTGEDIHYNELYSLRYEEFIALNTMMIQKAFEEINKIKNKIGG